MYFCLANGDCVYWEATYYPVANQWSNFSVVLVDENFQTTTTGLVLRDVLPAVNQLLIRGEWVSGADEEGVMEEARAGIVRWR